MACLRALSETLSIATIWEIYFGIRSNRVRYEISYRFDTNSR